MSDLVEEYDKYYAAQKANMLYHTVKTHTREGLNTLMHLILKEEHYVACGGVCVVMEANRVETFYQAITLVRI